MRCLFEQAVTIRLLAVFMLLLVFFACGNRQEKVEVIADSETTGKTSMSADTIREPVIPDSQFCALEQAIVDAGLVEVQQVVPAVLVDLKYTTEDNFMGLDLYGKLNRCYLQPDVAIKLKRAYNYLQHKDSSLTFLVYDGVRPRSVQQAMWDTLDMPAEEKAKYVSNPQNGSLHNFGAAIDLTLAYKEDGEALDMGTPYDFFGIEAYPIKEPLMLEKNRITQEAVDNRKLLRRCMMEGGFFNIQTEWWHFNSCYREEAIELYEIVEGG